MSVFGPYPARVVDVHDGDTIHLDVDVGFGVLLASHDLDGKPVLSCRALGINAPELKVAGVDNPAGIAARDYAATLLPAGARVQVTSHGWDKYGGRYDGKIKLPDGRDFAQVMLESGHAVVMA